MNTFLLTWNKERWNWDKIDIASKITKEGKLYNERWSCNTKQIHTGDRVFLIKLGKKPRGIIASGYVTSELYESEHWDEEKRLKGKTVNRVNIDFDIVLNPDEEVILNIEELNTGILSNQHWSSQSSGIRIKDEVAKELEAKWRYLNKNRVVNKDQVPNEFEIKDSEKIVEGAKKQIIVNAYERNSEARKKCIDYYGSKCIICGFDAGEVYGEEFVGKIHVHHIKPLSEIKDEYVVDPINDLIPVCPNCHMILHSKDEVYTPDQIKIILNRKRK